MLVDLIQVTSRDGVRLDGVFQAPAETAAVSVGVDAFCLVHGTNGNFYTSSLLEGFADRLRQLGCAVLRVNTRGHDGVSNAVTARGGKRLGAAYETVDDCRHDLAAWVDWLRQKAGPRVGLLGHSLGAVKCLYAVAHEPQLGPACLIALSPPRLSYSWFCSSPQGPDFLATYQQAERYIEAGQPLTLMEVQIPLPYLVTAAGYVEKYGPNERYNYLEFVRSIPCPTLFTFGSREVEGNLAFREAPLAIEERTKGKGRVRVEVIPGGDHFYTGVRDEVLARAGAWLRS